MAVCESCGKEKRRMYRERLIRRAYRLADYFECVRLARGRSFFGLPIED
jgi:hypothetical protein